MHAISRDRLARPVDISSLYPGAARRVNLIVDEPGLLWSGLSGNVNRNVSASHVNRSGRRGVGSGSGHGRSFNRVLPVARGNRTVARGRGRRSPLPYWYPRTPLRDITFIARAIERRRAEVNDEQAAGAPQEEASAPASTVAHLEQEPGASTPIPNITLKPQITPATQLWKIVTCMHNENKPGLDFITPQKKLLDSIERVREAWLEEQRKLEKTPSAKKAEREKKIRTLMSMR